MPSTCLHCGYTFKGSNTNRSSAAHYRHNPTHAPNYNVDATASVELTDGMNIVLDATASDVMTADDMSIALDALASDEVEEEAGGFIFQSSSDSEGEVELGEEDLREHAAYVRGFDGAVVYGVRAVDQPPLPEDGGGSKRVLEAQEERERVVEETVNNGDEMYSAVLSLLVKAELRFLGLVQTGNMSNRVADAVLAWARNDIGGPVGSLLPSLRSIQSLSVSLEGALETNGLVEGMSSVKIRVPKRYTTCQDGEVEFKFANIMDALVGLLLNKSLVKREDDLLWRSKLYDEDGNRRYTMDINTGDWWDRTERKYLTHNGMIHELCHLLGVLVFIDETQVVNKGSRTACPIVVTLANFPGRIRQRQDAWVIVGYLPRIETKAEKLTASFTMAKSYLFQQCLLHLFKPLVESFNEGGLYVKVLGQQRGKYFVWMLWD